MDMVEAEREQGQRLSAEAAMARLENSHLRKVLCTVLAATQHMGVDDDSREAMGGLSEMIEDALATASVFQPEDPA